MLWRRLPLNWGTKNTIASTARPPADLPLHCAGPCDPCASQLQSGAAPGHPLPAGACPAPQRSQQQTSPFLPVLCGVPRAVAREQWDARGSRFYSQRGVNKRGVAGEVLEAQKHSYRLHSGAQQLYPKLATLLQSQKHSCCPSVIFQFVLSCQTTPRSAVWYLPVEPDPVRDCRMLHRDTSPAGSHTMGSAGGAAVSQRRVLVAQDNEQHHSSIHHSGITNMVDRTCLGLSGPCG